MKKPVKIVSESQYKALLDAFCNKVVNTIPKEENASIATTGLDTVSAMQFGSSAIQMSLTTKSSGVDNYIVYVDNNNYGQFVRLM